MATAFSPADLPPPRRKWFGWMRRGSQAATDLLFPAQCVDCEAPCESALDLPLLCPACREQLQPSAVPACPRCAMPCTPADAATGPCPDCRSRKLLFEAVRTIGLYQGPLRKAVLRIKHAQFEPLAAALGELLAARIRQSPFAEKPDLVAPVPMFWLTRWLRGANAAETLAAAVARSLDLPLAADLLVCRRYLRTQAALRANERRRNVRHAFRTSLRYNIQGARILLVDDVLTTGATAHDCSRALLKSGAAGVYVAAAVRGTGER